MNEEHTPENDASELEALRKALSETQATLRRLRSIVDASPAVVFLWGVSDGWPVEFVSESISQFGYSARELVSGEISWPDVTCPEDVRRLETEVDDYLARGVEQFDQEYRIVTKSGDIRWIEDRNRVIRDADGQITHIQGMIVDITKRKEMEAALRDSEAGLKAVQRLAGVGGWQWNLRTGQTVQSEELLRIYGLPESTPPKDVEKVIDSIMHPVDLEDMRRLMVEVLSGGEGRDISFRIVRPDGEVRWLDATKYTVRQRDAEGSPTIIMGAVRDVTEARDSRIALQQSEEKYRALVESAGEAICTINADGVFLFVNTVCALRFGGAPDQFVGKSVWDIFPREFADAHMPLVREAIASGDGETREVLVPLEEGKRWYLISMEPMTDHDGRIRSTLIIARDITEHKQAEIALQQSEEKYRVLVESAGEAICTLDARGVYLFMNTTAARRLGGTPEDFVGKTMWDVFPKAIADRQAGHVRDIILGGVGDLSETLTYLGGQPRWYQTSIEPIRDHNGEIRSALVIARDVTDRKQAEDKLKQSEAFHRTLFEGAVEGIIIADIETSKFKFANPAICELLQYSSEELLQMGVRDIHPPEHLPHVMAQLQAQITGRHRVAQAVPFVRKDGRTVYFDVAASMVRLEGRDCVVGFFRDLTESRQAEEALRTAHMKLVNARDEERKYLAAELHDSVSQKLVALGMLLNNPSKAPSLSAAETCNELIEDIRSICRGLYPPALETFGLVAAMQPLKGHCRAAGMNAEIRCRSEIANARFAPEVEIALFRISQEAVNNAIRHSGAANMDIDLMLIDNRLLLSIVDDGRGFDVREARGTGFGLSSMTDRATAVGGDLTISSEPGETRIEVFVATDTVETDGSKGQ